MTRPDPRQQAALSAAFSGAIDLAALKRPAPGPADEAVVSSPYVMTVDEPSFGDAIAASNEIPVVFDLWSPRSAVSTTLSPILAKLAVKAAGAWILARVDVDTNPRIAQAFAVKAVPTVVAVAGGQPVDAFSGAQPEDQVSRWIASILDLLREQMPAIALAEQASGQETGVEAEPVDPRFMAAEDLLDEGDYLGAEKAYQAILAQEPGNAMAASALAQVGFLSRVEGHPEDAVTLADAAPDDITMQAAAADLEFAAGEVESAFSRLIAVVRRTAGDERTQARELLLGLFALLPTDDERLVKARRSLAAALY